MNMLRAFFHAIRLLPAGIALLLLALAMPAFAISYVTQGAASANNSVTVTLAATPAVGDLLIAHVATNTTDRTITPSVSGWTELRTDYAPSLCLPGVTCTIKSQVFYKFHTAVDPTFYTFTVSGGGARKVTAGITVYNGVDAASPFLAHNASPSLLPGATVTAPSLAVSAPPGSMLVALFGVAAEASYTTLPASYTSRYTITNTGGGAGHPTLAAVTRGPLAAAETPATQTATASTSLYANLGIHLALRPGGFNHIRIEHSGSGLTCTPSAITLKACADAACSTLYTGGVSGNLTWANILGGSPNGSVAFTIGVSGSTTVNLAVTSPITVALGTSAVSPIPSGTSPQCVNTGGGAACQHQFADTGFLFSTIPTQTAGVTSGSLTLRAVKKADNSTACTGLFSGNVTLDMASQCINPTTCNGRQVTINSTAIANNPAAGISSYTPVTLNFGANSTATFTLDYPDVGAMSLTARYQLAGSDYMTGTSNSFVVKPYGFTVSDIKRTADSFANPGAADATGSAFIKAGASFTATVTAIAFGDVATPNYGRESTPEGVKLTPSLVRPTGGNNPALTNGTIAGSAFTNGVATPTNLAWNEVGVITLTPSVADGNYLGAGDVTGTTTGNIGRFYPDHFQLSSGTLTNRTDISPACSPASTFTYMDEPFRAGFTLTAKGPSPGNVTLQNYLTSATPADDFAKLTTGSPIPTHFGFAFLDGTTNLTARLDGSLGISGSWASGVLDATATLGFRRDTAPDGPYNAMKVGIAPQDADGVTLGTFDMDVTPPAGNDHAEIGETQIRFGRLRLANAHGSELLDLPVPIQVQYWNGTLFTTNTADSCTTLASSSIHLDKSPVSLPTSLTPATIVFTSGVGSMKLTKPGAGNSGHVDLCVDLGSDPSPGTVCSATIANKAYLQGKWPPATGWDNDPRARATFGIYKNANEFIYLREMY